MTIWYPDVSHHNSGVRIEPDTVAVVAKASEGRTFTDPAYKDFRVQAARVGAVFAAYHWLWPAGSSPIDQQAQHAYRIVGKVPLMIDAENVSPLLTVGHIADFIDAYRGLGGLTRLLYLPRWYWGRMGSPKLDALRSRDMLLVASEYRRYDDNDWPDPYGGMPPYVWQYTNHLAYGGKHVDFNACKDTVRGFADEIGAAPVAGTPPVVTKPPSRVGPPPGPPVDFPLPPGYYFGPKEGGVRSVSGFYRRRFKGRLDRDWLRIWARQLGRRGWPVGKGRRYLRKYGNDGLYGSEYAALAEAFQRDQHLHVDGLIGRQTWDAAYHNPVTV